MSFFHEREHAILIVSYFVLISIYFCSVIVNIWDKSLVCIVMRYCSMR